MSGEYKILSAKSYEAEHSGSHIWVLLKQITVTLKSKHRVFKCDDLYK